MSRPTMSFRKLGQAFERLSPMCLGAGLSAALAVSACRRTVEEPTGNSAVATVKQPAEPASAIPSSVRSVWGSGANDVWAAGDKGGMAHFDGHKWTASKSGTNKDLTGVHGSGPDDVWAVGQAGTTLH